MDKLSELFLVQADLGFGGQCPHVGLGFRGLGF